MSSAPKKSATKMLGTFLVIGLLLLVVVIDVQRRRAEDQLAQLSMRLSQLSGNTSENQEEAKAIIAKVGKLIDLPTDVEPTVATIVDVEALRKQNKIYDKAENGDNLIVTPDRAILYSTKRNVIIDVVPVQIQAPEQPAPTQGSQKSTATQQNTSTPQE